MYTGWQNKIKHGLLMLFTGTIIAVAGTSFANPQGGSVAAGSATISSNNNTLQVNQNSNKAIINWNTFNIAPNQTTRFNQPSSGAIMLNRVNASYGASKILGTLSANGQIWIINPAGILFGASAQVNVAGLLAATANISDADFLSGKYNFIQSPDWHGGIVNRGNITIAANGMAILVAPGVENSGVIHATLGTVVLAAANEYTIDFYGDQLINFGVNSEVITPATNPRNGHVMTSGVSNSGKIFANGGTVILSAETAENILDNSVNMSGSIEAKSAENVDGDIILMGSDGGVNVTGKIVASGNQPGQTGGTIKILGNEVVLSGNAQINAAGAAGGGNILIGGDAHGIGTDPDSNYVYLGPNVILNASALQNGNGGNVVVWSNLGTQFYGNIFATGGKLGGNGGQVETSGAEYLDAAGMVTANAPFGVAGNWLLDPANVSITTTTTNGSFNGGSPDTYTTTANTATANVATIDAALNLGTSVTILTTPGGTQAGTITVNSPILQSSGSGGGTLTLNAASTLTVTAGDTISSTSGPLNVALISGGNLTINAGITTNGGFFTSSVTGNTAVDGALNAGTGNASLTSTGTITQTAAITAATLTAETLNNAGSKITLTNAGNSATNINLSALNAAGTANAAGAIAYTQANSFNVNNISTSSTAALTASAGSISQTGPISATTLTTNSQGGTLLNNTSNLITGFNGTNAGSGDIQLTNGSNLSVTGVNETGGGNFIVNNTGTLAITGATTTDTGNVELTATGAITQSAAITAPTLIAQTLNNAGAGITLATATNNSASVNLSTLNAAGTANAAGAISYRSSTALGIANIQTAGSATVTAGGALTQTGAIIAPTFTANTFLTAGAPITLTNSGNNSATISLNTLSNNGTTTEAGAINYQDATGFSIAGIKTTSTINLTSPGSIAQSAIIAGSTLTLSSVGGTILNSANTLTGFNASNTTSGDIQLTNAGALSVTGISESGGGNFDLTNTGTTAITGAVNTGTGNMTLSSTGAVSQTAAITTPTLNVTTLANAGAAINLNNAGNNSSAISLNAENAAGTANAAGVITYADSNGFNINNIGTTSTVTLTSGGAIAQTGAIAGTTLTLSSAGGSVLNAANTLTGFKGTNITSGDIQFTNTGNLSVTGITESGGGNFILNNTGTTAITGAVNTGTGNATLSSTGAVTQTAAITAPTLNVTTLANAGAAITLSNAGNNSSAINLNAENAAGSANAAGAITYVDSSGFNINNIGTASTATLTSSGAIAQTGAIAGTTLTLSSVGGAVLNAANTLTAFKGTNTSSGDIQFTNTGNLSVTGITESGGGNFVLNNTGTTAITGAVNTGTGNAMLTLSGALSQSAAITSQTLTVQTVGGALLNSANVLTGFNGTNTTSGDIQLTNTGSLSVTGISESGGGNFVLSNTGTTAITGAVNTNTGNMTLSSTGAVSQTAAITTPV